MSTYSNLIELPFFHDISINREDLKGVYILCNQPFGLKTSCLVGNHTTSFLFICTVFLITIFFTIFLQLLILPILTGLGGGSAGAAAIGGAGAGGGGVSSSAICIKKT